MKCHAIHMKFKFKIIFTLICCIILVLYYCKIEFLHLFVSHEKNSFITIAKKFQRICYYYGKTNQNFSCLAYKGNVFIPFPIIRQKYELNGAYYNGNFYIKHSTHYRMANFIEYNWNGTYPSFEHFFVEARSRVKCICPNKDVPISNQWFKDGFYYATQIAQFGLQYYSKLSISTNQLSNKSILDIIKEELGFNGIKKLKETSELQNNDDVQITFKPPLNDDLIYLKFVLQGYIKPESSIEIMLILKKNIGQNLVPNKQYHLTYLLNDTQHKVPFGEKCFSVDHTNSFVYYHITPSKTSIFNTSRNVIIDLIKAFKLHPKSLQINGVRLINLSGAQFNLFEFTSAPDYKRHVANAVNWILESQDKHGGWPNAVHRKRRMTLAPGWYSAMAQGQVLSLLSRHYSQTQSLSSLVGALRGFNIFNTRIAPLNISNRQNWHSSNEAETSFNGVKSEFLPGYPWLEEYPTDPPSMVLNGFMYSIVGIHDLSQALVHYLSQIKPSSSSSPLPSTEDLKTSLDSINKMLASLHKSLRFYLPLFDTGSSTYYDLYHWTRPGTIPNRARWDYHIVHINLLRMMHLIYNDTYFADFAARWSTYLYGERVPHN